MPKEIRSIVAIEQIHWNNESSTQTFVSATVMNTQRQDKIHTVNYLLVICVESQLSESDIHSFKIAIVQEESFFVPKIYILCSNLKDSQYDERPGARAVPFPAIQPSMEPQSGLVFESHRFAWHGRVLLIFFCSWQCLKKHFQWSCSYTKKYIPQF